jgi:hypothetical protein
MSKSEEPDLPPASLSFLITTLGMQAMLSLGQMPNPATGKTEVHLEQARHFIDTLQVLESKTAGNTTPEEAKLMESLLSDLRMAFVQIRDKK